MTWMTRVPKRVFSRHLRINITIWSELNLRLSIIINIFHARYKIRKYTVNGRCHKHSGYYNDGIMQLIVRLRPDRHLGFGFLAGWCHQVIMQKGIKDMQWRCILSAAIVQRFELAISPIVEHIAFIGTYEADIAKCSIATWNSTGYCLTSSCQNYRTSLQQQNPQWTMNHARNA